MHFPLKLTKSRGDKKKERKKEKSSVHLLYTEHLALSMAHSRPSNILKVLMLFKDKASAKLKKNKTHTHRDWYLKTRDRTRLINT